jgi:hypothetical protein
VCRKIRQDGKSRLGGKSLNRQLYHRMNFSHSISPAVQELALLHALLGVVAFADGDSQGAKAFCHCCAEAKAGRIRGVKRWTPRLAILVLFSTTLALAEDFKTVTGKVYKDATITSVEVDGIVLKTKTGISKVYFVELPKEVQERFHYGSTSPTGKPGIQRINETESAKPSSTVVDGTTAVDKFAQRVSKELEEREAILQGKHTPGPAETAILRELTFHKGFLVGTAIIAAVLFAVVWARVR